MRYFLLLLVGLALFIPSRCQATDWPSWRQNSHNQNQVSYQPSGPFNLVRSVPSQYFSPLIAGDLLLTAESGLFGQRLVARQLSTGQEAWQFKLANQFPRQPVVHQGTVYFGLYGQPTLYAVSLFDGRLRWQAALPGERYGVRSSPVVMTDGVVVAASRLHKLSLSGQIIWSQSVDVSSPIALADERLIIRTHDQKIQAVDGANGEVLWQQFTNTTAGTAPVIDGQRIYVGTFQKIFALNLATGHKYWERDLGDGNGTIGPLALRGDHLVASTDGGNMFVFRGNGDLAWRRQINGQRINGNGWLANFIVAGDRIIAEQSAGRQILLDILSGNIIEEGGLFASATFPQAISDRYLIFAGQSAANIFEAAGWQKGQLSDPGDIPPKNPVIIIPGVVGSWWDGKDWRLDPILKTFDPLLAHLRLAGYVDDITLFSFGYDWRQANSRTAYLLKDKIEAIKAKTGQAKVDLVAHSMGGLVAAAYITSDSYSEDVDQLITIGTPFRGSVKAYPTWEAGEIGGSLIDQLKEQLIGVEAIYYGYGRRRVAYIQEKVPSAGELLPNFSYLEESGQLRAYQPCEDRFYPCNRFLDLLSDRYDRLFQRARIYNIAGQLPTPTTLSRFKVDPSSIEGYWFHGQPRDYPSSASEERSIGDGTVLENSATLTGATVYRLAGDHTSIISLAASRVIETLSGQIIPYEPPLTQPSFLLLRLASPGGIFLDGQPIELFYSDQTDKPAIIALPDRPAEVKLTVAPSDEAIGEGTSERLTLVSLSPADHQLTEQSIELVSGESYQLTALENQYEVSPVNRPIDSPTPSASPTGSPSPSPTITNAPITPLPAEEPSNDPSPLPTQPLPSPTCLPSISPISSLKMGRTALQAANFPL